MRKAARFLTRFCVDFTRCEEGQIGPFSITAIFLAYSLFMGAAIDMSNLWLHKYRAATAANAACAAGAADLVWVANQGTTQAVTNYQAASTGFTVADMNGSTVVTSPPANYSVNGTCNSSNYTSVAMCAYAKANGYDATASGMTVSWTVSNITPTPATVNAQGLGGVSSFTPKSTAPSTPSTSGNGVLPYLRVTVSESVATYLLSAVPWFHSPVSVSASCNCGMAQDGTLTTTGSPQTISFALASSLYCNNWTTPCSEEGTTGCCSFTYMSTSWPPVPITSPTMVTVSSYLSGPTPPPQRAGILTGTVEGDLSCDGGNTWTVTQSYTGDLYYWSKPIQYGQYVSGATSCTLSNLSQLVLSLKINITNNQPTGSGEYYFTQGGPASAIGCCDTSYYPIATYTPASSEPKMVVTMF